MKTLLHEKFVVDGQGKTKAVLFDYNDYKKLVEMIEESRTIKIINDGINEFTSGKMKVVKSLKELD